MSILDSNGIDFEYPKDLSPPDYVIESYKDLEI